LAGHAAVGWFKELAIGSSHSSKKYSGASIINIIVIVITKIDQKIYGIPLIN
jgi:hypothetical protein